MFFLACSSGEDKPNAPPTLISGRISIYNQTDYPIRLLDFTQQRNDDQYQRMLNMRVYPRHSFSLKNYLDGGNSEIFPGGDRVWVTFASEMSDPENPGHPLFQNTVGLTINGNNTISVKDGGQYSIGPG